MKEKPKMSSIPDLTPPGKSNKTPKAPPVVVTEPAVQKAEKAAKPVKEPKTPKDPNAPKAPRAPRADYGYRPDAMIHVVPTKDISKLRGQRKAWYDKIVLFGGKKVSEFTDMYKENPKDPPRGWVRFFAQEGFITLSGGTVPTPKETSPKSPKEESPTTPTTPPAA